MNFDKLQMPFVNCFIEKWLNSRQRETVKKGCNVSVLNENIVELPAAEDWDQMNAKQWQKIISLQNEDVFCVRFQN